MKKSFIAILAIVLVVAAVAAIGFSTVATNPTLENLFYEAKAVDGYTSDELLVLTSDYVSSEKIAVSSGDTVWFGPCEPAQYFQLVGQDGEGKAVTGKIRGKDLEIADTFNNGTVIYKYTVPTGVAKLVFSAPAELKDVYTVTKTALSELIWRAYWDQNGKNPDDYVGQSSYYKVEAGDKLYFGAITEADALTSKIYDGNGLLAGTMAKADLTLVESFGGKFGIYCYTVPAGVDYVYVTYDSDYEQYYYYVINPADEAGVVDEFIKAFGVPQPLSSTVEALKGKTALFLGDSITYGARDRANIYEYGSWAGRIGYYVGMDVQNNGVSGACITTARVESHSAQHYILNNLLATKGTEYDYVIMHGLFNDASITPAIEMGTMQGKANFDPAKADESKFIDALELLFYTARKQNPNAILGYIVNFKTERTVDQAPFVKAAIQVCEAWDIQYLDLYDMEGFSVEFDDGLHPSSAGYDGMYNTIANWMATLDPDTGVTASTAKVMSYNVYFGGDEIKNTDYVIANRHQKVLSLIAEESPDILMMQEFTNNTFGPAFDAAFEGVYDRSGTTHWTTGDEMAPIAWKTDLYTLVEENTLRVEDSDYPRAINWVVLQDKQEQKLLVMSVHGQPDKDGGDKESLRNETMLLITQEIARLQAKYEDLAVIVGGDFNMQRNSTAYNNLVTGGLTDLRAAVDPSYVTSSSAQGTYNDWTRAESKFGFGDYMFMAGDMTASVFRICTDDLDEQRSDDLVIRISDHCPIIADITY